MTKHTVSLESKNQLINPTGLIDNIVQARNQAFSLERSDDLNLEILKKQIDNFSDQENAKQFKQYLEQLNNKAAQRQPATQYLNKLDAPIRTQFKQVPKVLKNILETLEDLEESYIAVNNGKNSQETQQNINECLSDLTKETSAKKKEVDDLLLSISNFFKEDLLPLLELSRKIIKCNDRDKDAKENKEVASKQNSSQDDQYKKNYYEYTTNINLIAAGEKMLQEIQQGVKFIKDNFELVSNYYNSFTVPDRLKISEDKPIDQALDSIRSLIKANKEKLTMIEKFTKDLK